MIDIHTHILPGIDDGAKTMADAVAIVENLAAQGVTDIIATPHFMNETIFMSSRRENLKLLKELRAKVLKRGVKVNLYLGNEIYINEEIVNLIKAGKIATLNETEYLLVELPINGKYPNYLDLLKDLVDRGLKVILAHPERYAFIQENYAEINEILETGVLLQCNLGSLTGKYGKMPKKIVKKLIKERKVFAFGSDIHRASGSEYVGKAKKKLARYYNARELGRVLETNPRKILAKE